MLTLAVTLHNIPEGMAVGVVYASWLSGSREIALTGALALSLGIAIQNFPEGAILSLPLHAEGMRRSRAFGAGVLSGAVEPPPRRSPFWPPAGWCRRCRTCSALPPGPCFMWWWRS